MFEIGHMTALFGALGIAVLGFVLGSLATFALWMKSEESDLKQGYIEIAGDCYQLEPMEDLSHGRRTPTSYRVDIQRRPAR
jgi:hypothetical protein